MLNGLAICRSGGPTARNHTSLGQRPRLVWGAPLALGGAERSAGFPTRVWIRGGGQECPPSVVLQKGSAPLALPGHRRPDVFSFGQLSFPEGHGPGVIPAWANGPGCLMASFQ